jgi:hypothetical protein
MNIMKLLTTSTINPVIETNGAFPHQMSFSSATSNMAAPFIHVLPDSGKAPESDRAERSERAKARSEGARFGLAVLAVIGAATLWGWALMQLCGLFLQAESLLLRTSIPLS